MTEKKLVKIINKIDEFIELNPLVGKIIGLGMIFLFYTIGIITLIYCLKQI